MTGPATRTLFWIVSCAVHQTALRQTKQAGLFKKLASDDALDLLIDIPGTRLLEHKAK